VLREAADGEAAREAVAELRVDLDDLLGGCGVGVGWGCGVGACEGCCVGFERRGLGWGGV